MSTGRSAGARRILGLLARPELGAAAAAVLVWMVFAAVAGPPFRSLEGTAAVLNAAAPLGILAVAVALLMIAGEFDLSIGSIIGCAGMTIMLLTRQYDWSLWPAIGVAVAAQPRHRPGNGYLVVRTGLPSFIVTLGTLFAFRGLTIAREPPAHPSDPARRARRGVGIRSRADAVRERRLRAVSDLGALVAGTCRRWPTWVLLRTRFGNWIFAAGGGAGGGTQDGCPRGAGEDHALHGHGAGRRASWR